MKTIAIFGDPVQYRLLTDSGQFTVLGRRVEFPGFEEFQFAVGCCEDVNDGRYSVTELTTGRKVTASEDMEWEAVASASKRLSKLTPEMIRKGLEDHLSDQRGTLNHDCEIFVPKWWSSVETRKALSGRYKRLFWRRTNHLCAWV